MSESLRIPVPEQVPTTYVVAMRRPPSDPRAALDNRLAACASGTLRTVAGDLLDSGAARIDTRRAADSPWSGAFCRAALSEIGAAERLWHAAHHVSVTVPAGPAAQPGRAQSARAIARALARAGDGLIFDPASGRILAGINDSPEPEAFRLCDDWLSLSADGAQDEHGTARAGEVLTQRTAGLRRFGLPELALPGVRPDQVLAGISLLRGVAVTVLRELWTHLAKAGRPEPAGPWSRPATLRFGVAEIWQYWGRAGLEMWRERAKSRPEIPDGGRIVVDLSVRESGGASHLVVRPERVGGGDPAWLRIAATTTERVGSSAPMRMAA